MTPLRLHCAAERIGRALGAGARRLGIGPALTSAAMFVLRRLDPGHPLLTRAAAADSHEGPAALSHWCRCDSHLLPPATRARPHLCHCADEDAQDHLPAGGPPFITGGRP